MSEKTAEKVDLVQDSVDNGSTILFGDMSLFDNKKVTERGQDVRVRNNSGELTVQFFTNNAIGLYRGIPPRKDAKGKVINRGQLGLTKMDDLLSAVYTAARNDDPYADQLIYNLHLASLQLAEIIKQSCNVIATAMNQKLGRGVAAKIKKDDATEVFNVYLKTELGRNIFWQIQEIDQFVLENLFCRQYAIIPRDASVKMNGTLSSTLWNMYHSVYVWKHTGVTRKDIAENNQVAQRASAEIGDRIIISEGVMDKSKRSSLAPRIVERPEDVIVNHKDDLKKLGEVAKAESLE